MIVGLANSFPADAVERAVPDVASARRLVGAQRTDVGVLLAARRDLLLGAFGNALLPDLDRCEDALLLALARFGVRHGSWGSDFHHYHNENHALEVLDGRLGQLLKHAGTDALDARDWLALSLFAACHDLRQREVLDFSHPIGNNEAASIAETARILELAGFDATRDRRLFLALQLMIAGSTFDARPAPPTAESNSAELAASGGALAPKLPAILDAERPGWREDADIVRAVELAQIASDLDTANVAEPLVWLAESASRLCQEREMRFGRALDSAESAQPCAGFLSTGQERYFFDLHRFCSALGRTTFEPGKRANAQHVRAMAAQIGTARFDTGADALRAFSALALARG
ncbi:hypothetical protein [Chiayiivirga flava]|uniref:Uncharacterized protein n=1 Tax=Chiayiivirga flava TaxID=659595 RepID=A0A7W8D663_9GAMM|nr:hypothetical protein [Chiayiivirga flava]MBB5207510.1 hypothetical protein [Chiayiivirga flava]